MVKDLKTSNWIITVVLEKFFSTPYIVIRSRYKDGGRLSAAHDRYSIDQSTGTLVITNAQLDDSAHFRCSASNYLGRAGSAARVKVNPDTPEGGNFSSPSDYLVSLDKANFQLPP